MMDFTLPYENTVSLHQGQDTIISNQIKETHINIQIHSQTSVLHEWILGPYTFTLHESAAAETRGR